MSNSRSLNTSRISRKQRYCHVVTLDSQSHRCGVSTVEPLMKSTFKTSSGCTALNMPEPWEMADQIDWREKQPLQAVCVSEDQNVLRRMRHYLRTRSEGHHAIDRLEEREVWKEETLDDLAFSNGRDRAIVSPTNIGTLELFQRRVEHIWAFFERIDTILNWKIVYDGWKLSYIPTHPKLTGYSLWYLELDHQQGR